MSKEIILQLKGIHKKFSHEDVLKGVNLTLFEGDRVVLQGASGSGKSTLLHLMAGLDEPSTGEIYFLGKNLTHASDDYWAKLRNEKIGLIFQFHFLLSTMSGWNNILLPSRIGGRKSVKEVKTFLSPFIEELEMGHLLDKKPHELSGGQQQRVSLLRAISLSPKLLLCDEPTGGLDSLQSQKVTKLLLGLAEKLGITLVVVTHDEQVASHFSKRILIKDGIV